MAGTPDARAAHEREMDAGISLRIAFCRTWSRALRRVCAVGLINGNVLVADWPEDRELPMQT